MPNPTITATVSDADVAAIKAAIATIQQKLPFLVTITTLASRRTFKAGPNSLAFVENALQVAENNPAILPASFNALAFANSVALFSTLTDIDTVVGQLKSELADTRLVVGGQAMEGGTDVYNYVKAAVKKTPGLKPLADQLGTRFQHASTATAAPATAK
jgi:hypothetical protein